MVSSRPQASQNCALWVLEDLGAENEAGLTVNDKSVEKFDAT